MLTNLYVIDDGTDRAYYASRLLEGKNVPRPEIVQLSELEASAAGVAIVHWTLIDLAYSALSRLRAKSFQVIFYCLCPEKRMRGSILLLPDDLDEMITRIESTPAGRLITAGSQRPWE